MTCRLSALTWVAFLLGLISSSYIWTKWQGINTSSPNRQATAWIALQTGAASGPVSISYEACRALCAIYNLLDISNMTKVADVMHKSMRRRELTSAVVGWHVCRNKFPSRARYFSMQGWLLIMTEVAVAQIVSPWKPSGRTWMCFVNHLSLAIALFFFFSTMSLCKVIHSLERLRWLKNKFKNPSTDSIVHANCYWFCLCGSDALMDNLIYDDQFLWEGQKKKIWKKETLNLLLPQVDKMNVIALKYMAE